MKKQNIEKKQDKRTYKKPELTRHEKLSMVTGGPLPSGAELGCTRL